ncbi:MAG TPA: SUMF1/EgtB/PvdO family nonheme iron enzyme [Bacteroidia bacterium]
MKKQIVKQILLAGTVAATLYSCGDPHGGQLVGAQGRPKWYQPDPFGMVYIPMGSYNMGPSDQDVPSNFTSQSKTVTVEAFYMDQTEISNNEYRQFVEWVRDSMARRLLGEAGIDGFYIEEDEYEEYIVNLNLPDPPRINWKTKIKWDDPEQAETLEEMYYPQKERYYAKRELDVRKYVYHYYWIDYRKAASDPERGQDDRSPFIREQKVKIYPDTLCWVADYSYSYNEPHTKMYFWHPAYDDYPVVGITWHQANAFSHWRTSFMNNYLYDRGEFPVHDFRLPTEAEWEYAARGNLELSPYPWGGPYIRNSKGCFLGNFKPLRGNYKDDGGAKTVQVESYNPNGYGLYCMAGNVSEWCRDAFDPSGYSFAHDLNPDLYFEEADADKGGPVARRAKVIRGGSWKDVGFFLQVSSRDYEYQDSCKSYIGFRNVQTFMGRAKEDYK